MSGRLDMAKVRQWIKISSLTLAVLMLRVWVNVEGQRIERQLKSMRTEADRLTYENGRLQMQIHQYEAPSHLEMLAKTQYSMVPLEPSHRIGLQP